ncbi:MAG: phosphatidate cytidylyltransferase, partial [Candidatus Cloacimonadota bacterium]
MGIYENNKERINTGFTLVAVALLIGYIDSFLLTWAVVGVIYILAFNESLLLFGIKDTKLLFYAIGIWLLALIYPYGDDLFVLAGVAYASAIAYNPELKWKSFFPFIYPTAGMLFLFTMYQEYGM